MKKKLFNLNKQFYLVKKAQKIFFCEYEIYVEISLMHHRAKSLTSHADDNHSYNPIKKLDKWK